MRRSRPWNETPEHGSDQPAVQEVIANIGRLQTLEHTRRAARHTPGCRKGCVCDTFLLVSGHRRGSPQNLLLPGANDTASSNVPSNTTARSREMPVTPESHIRPQPAELVAAVLVRFRIGPRSSPRIGALIVFAASWAVDHRTGSGTRGLVSIRKVSSRPSGSRSRRHVPPRRISLGLKRLL